MKHFCPEPSSRRKKSNCHHYGLDGCDYSDLCERILPLRYEQSHSDYPLHDLLPYVIKHDLSALYMTGASCPIFSPSALQPNIPEPLIEKCIFCLSFDTVTHFDLLGA